VTYHVKWYGSENQGETDLMKLEDWRKTKGMSFSCLAREVGASHASVARRWCLGGMVPSTKFMTKIVMLTEGQVQPNDFFK
jgi:predicted transcriptional regulator